MPSVAILFTGKVLTSLFFWSGLLDELLFTFELWFQWFIAPYLSVVQSMASGADSGTELVWGGGGEGGGGEGGGGREE
jgi:hypothetical protein